MMPFNAIITDDNELNLCRDWDDDLMVVQDEELSATSNEEANKVFEEWKADDDVMDEIMEIDEQIGSNLLDEAIFDEPCLSPTGPLEELVYMKMETEDQDRFLVPSLEDAPASSSAAGRLEPKAPAAVDTSKPDSEALEEQYNATLKKLAESMKRSQETRKSLTLTTPKTKKYARSSKVNGVLSSIEQSSRQIQLILEKNQRNM